MGSVGRRVCSEVRMGGGWGRRCVGVGNSDVKM